MCFAGDDGWHFLLQCFLPFQVLLTLFPLCFSVFPFLFLTRSCFVFLSIPFFKSLLFNRLS